MLRKSFGEPAEWPSQDLIGFTDEFGADLAFEGYRCGVFPMPLPGGQGMGWWSPMQRGIIPFRQLHVTRSLRKSAKRYTTTVDAAFPSVITECAAPDRPDGWIDQRIILAYEKLAMLGIAHSVEVWDDDGALVGGLYGIHVGGLFAGESMFHHPELGRDASKVALIRLAVELIQTGVILLDTQWLTEHLGSLGAYEIPREEYLSRLGRALALPTAPWGGGRLDGTALLARWDARDTVAPFQAHRGRPGATIVIEDDEED